jgi:thiamine transport system permease protein
MSATLLMTLAYTRLQARATVPLDLRPRATNAHPPRGWRARLVVGANLAILLLLGTPLLALMLRSVTSFATGTARLTLEYYRLLDSNPTGSFFYVPPLRALANTLMFALAATALALLVGVPAAYLLSARTKNQEPRTTSGNRWFSVLGSRLSALLDPLFMLPLGASAATLGLGYIVALGRPPLNLLTSPLLIPIAHALLAFPFVVRSLLPALRGFDPRLREAARTLGAGPARVLREIDLPLLFPALLVGAVFAFTVSIGEFGAALLLYRPEYPTVPVVIDRFLGLPGQQNYGQALALSSILMLITGLSFVLLEQVRFRNVGEF